MWALVCCRSPRTDSPPPKAKETVEIALTPQNPPLTTAINPASHVNSPSFEEDYVLRNIFGNTLSTATQVATATSYEPATPPPCGDHPAVRKRVKSSPRNFQPFSGKVRERLSNSQLSRRSTKQSKEDRKPEEGVREVETNDHPTGLEELLTSRSVSQGGYDSDAKNIEVVSDSPPETPANPGSIKVSPKYLAKAVKNLDGSTTQAQSGLRTPRRQSSKDPRSNASGSTEPHPSRTKAKIRTPTRSNSLKAGARGSPDELIGPTKTVRGEVIEIDKTESPKQALRRLITTKSEGSSSNHASTSAAPRLPSFDEAHDNWRLSFSAPRRMSSLQQTPENNAKGNAASGDDMELTPTRRSRKGLQEQNVSPSSATNRMSLISSLDDSLVAQISRFFEYESPTKEQTPRATSPDNARLCPDKKERLDTVSRIRQNQDLHTERPVVRDRISSQNSARPRVFSDQDNTSVHLFNMRISQRLGSSSLDPVVTSSNSGTTSDLHDRCASINSMRSPLSACMPGAGTAGHLRKPSNSSTVEKNKLFPARRCLSDTRDDASSVYTNNEGGTPSSDNVSRGHHISPNGLNTPKRLSTCPSFYPGLGGRPFTSGVDQGSVTRLSTTENSGRIRPNTAGESISTSESNRVRNRVESNIFGRNPNAQSGPKESRFVENFALEDPQCSQQENVGNEEKDETAPCQITSRSRDLGILRHRQSLSSAARLSSNGWLTRRRSRMDFSNTASGENVGRPSLSSFRNQLAPTVSNSIQESAADMWERALRSAREEREQGSEQSWAGTVEASDARRKKQGDRGKQRAPAPNSPPSQDPLRSVSPSYADLRSPASNSFGSTLLLKSKKSIGDMFSRRKGTNGHRDISSWAKFPSHTRAERNEAARSTDKVATRDFSPKIAQTPQAKRLSSTPPKTPKGSWKRLGWRRKSKSMTFPTRASAKKALRKWSPLQFGGQSSDFRARAGRRTSISIGGPVEYPELELIPGYSNFSATGLGGSGDGSSEGLGVEMGIGTGVGGSTAALLKQPDNDRLETPRPATLPRKKAGRGLRFGFGRPERAARRMVNFRQDESTSSASREAEKMSPKRVDLHLPVPPSSLRRMTNTTRSLSDPNLLLSSNQPSSSSYAETPGLGQGQGPGSATAWSRVYADCLGLSAPASAPTPMNMPASASASPSGEMTLTATTNTMDTMQSLTTDADADADVSEYVSVTFSNSHDNDNRNGNDRFECGEGQGQGDSGSGDLDSTTGPYNHHHHHHHLIPGEVPNSNGLGHGHGQDHGQERRRILSSELRDSTVDFRERLQREQEGCRRGLMGLVERLEAEREGGHAHARA